MNSMRTLSLALALGAGAATAADLHVTVFDRITGFPVKGASVCLGNSEGVDRFAGARTDEDGVATFEALAWAHTLSVSQDGYDNIAVQQPARKFDFELKLEVLPGRSEPACWVSPDSVEAHAGIAITEVDVLASDSESGRIEIKTRTAGHEPTHVRVASRDDFAGSSWQAVKNGRSVHYVRNLSESVFVQVRRRIGDDTNNIESVSEIVTETL